MAGHRLVVFLVLPALVLLFIVAQAFYVAFAYADRVAVLILLVASLSIAVYGLGGWLAFRVARVREVSGAPAAKGLFVLLLALYGLSYLGLYYAYGGVPLLDLIAHGGNPSLMRMQFHKSTEGAWQLFAYGRSMLTRGFIPIAGVLIFCRRGRGLFYVALLLFTFTAVSAMEKSLLLWAYLPLLFHSWFARRRGDFCLILLLGLLVVALLSSLTFGRQDLAHQPAVNAYAVSEKAPPRPLCQGAESLRDTPNYQFLLHDAETGGAGTYLLNRLLWIPFVTVYDTFQYWAITHDGFLYLRVNRHLAALAGVEFADLERRVFLFQFDSGEESLGNSNAAYFTEAYVGFGFAGVCGFSLMVGVLFGWVLKSGVAAFVCTLPVIAFGLLSVSLISMLFSGGLLIFILCLLLLTRRAS